MGCSDGAAGSSFFSAEAEASAEAGASFFSASAVAEASALGSAGAAVAVSVELDLVVSALGGAKGSAGGVAALGGAKGSAIGVVIVLVEPKAGTESLVSTLKGKLRFKSSAAGIAFQSISVKVSYLVLVFVSRSTAET